METGGAFLFLQASQEDKHTRAGVFVELGSSYLPSLILDLQISAWTAQSWVGREVPAAPVAETPILGQEMQLHTQVLSPLSSFFFLLFTITHGEIFCVLHREKYSGELVKICPGCCWVCLCWEPLQS